MTLGFHAVLAVVSHGCPPPRDRYLRVTHPSATAGCPAVRLACVKHAASVRSEPGSNSQVHHVQSNQGQSLTRQNPNQTKQRRTNPASLNRLTSFRCGAPKTNLTSVTVTHQEYATATPDEHQTCQDRAHSQLHQASGQIPRPPPDSHEPETHGRRQRIPSIEYAIVKERRQTNAYSPRDAALSASSAC